MSEQTFAPQPNEPLDGSLESGRAKWERPAVILSSLKWAENGPVANPTFDGTTAAKVS